MRGFIRSAAFLVAMVAGACAQAETFNFSYTFNDGTAVEGSFIGTANGNLVTDLSHVFVSVDGTRMVGTGAMQAWSFDGTQTWQNEAVASFDGLANNFIFANAMKNTPAFANLFLMVPVGTQTQVQVVPFGYQLEWYDANTPAPTWHLEMAAPVPEVETYAMMVAGLGLLGVAARRRKAV